MKIRSSLQPLQGRSTLPAVTARNENSNPQPPEPSRDSSSGLFQQATNSLADGFRSYKALPGFLYPSVFGTAAEKELILRTLDSLPLKDVSKVATVSMKDTLGSRNLLGVNRPAIGTISINRSGYGMSNPNEVVNTLVHEVGHSVDYPNKITSILTGGHSGSEPFGAPPYVSHYAGSAAPEDFAESYHAFHMEPEHLKSVSPEKHQALQEVSQNNFLQSFVDRPAFRETGQFIGKALEASPFLRMGLEFAGQIAVFNVASDGVSDLMQGNYIRGAVGAGAAAALAFAQSHPALAPAGMALLGARDGFDHAYDHEAGIGGTAGAMIGAGVGGVAGGFVAPLGLTMAGHALAGPVGGTIGLVVGAFAGHTAGTALGARVGLAAGSRLDS